MELAHLRMVRGVDLMFLQKQVQYSDILQATVEALAIERYHRMSGVSDNYGTVLVVIWPCLG